MDASGGDWTFASAKPSELLALAKKVQLGEERDVAELIAINPRLLCTSADSPTILQEGARYNVLHIAARWGQSWILELVLRTISNYNFMARLYPNENSEINRARTKYLTDMYLNTPDKGTLETPLHFASKFNCTRAVRILIYHPLCDLGIRNIDNKLAKEIIGSRCSNRAEDKEESRCIHELFRNDTIVPIWRDPDCGVPAVVGKPINPRKLGIFTPSYFHRKMVDIDLNWYGPMDSSAIPKPTSGIQRIIRAYAGPMEENKAQEFYDMITHSGKYNGTSIMNSSTTSPRNSFFSPRLQSPAPMLNLGTLKQQHSDESPITSPICSSTPIRQAYRRNEGTPISFPNISEMLTPNKSQHCLQVVLDKQICCSDPEKGLEFIARKYARDMKVPFYEYWAFADKYLDFTQSDHLFLLERMFADKECRWAFPIVVDEKDDEVRYDMDMDVSSVCNALDNFHLNHDDVSKVNTVGETEAKRNRGSWKEDWRRRLPLVCDNLNAVSDSIDYILSITPILRPSVFQGNMQLAADYSDRLGECNKNVSENEQICFHAQENRTKCESDSIDPLRIREALASSSDYGMWSESSKDQSDCERRNSDDYFYSADASPGSDYEDCFTFQVFLEGESPGKEDFQLVTLIGSLKDEVVDLFKYPAISRWYNCLIALGNRNKRKRKLPCSQWNA